MPPFRKSGSFVRFFVDGEIGDPESDEFLLKLAQNRFRTIESSADEGTSVGWVSPADPSGQDFEKDQIVLGPCVRMRMRIDRKKLPATWLAIHMAAELRARGGNGISAKERKEIKADVADRVLPRVLPAVQFVDVVWSPRQRVVLLFATSEVVTVECAKLFKRTFDVRLVPADPTGLALRTDLPAPQARQLDEITPFTLELHHNGNGNGIARPRPAETAAEHAEEATT